MGFNDLKCFHVFDKKTDYYMFDVYADYVCYDDNIDLTVFFRDGNVYCSMYGVYFKED